VRDDLAIFDLTRTHFDIVMAALQQMRVPEISLPFGWNPMKELTGAERLVAIPQNREDSGTIPYFMLPHFQTPDIRSVAKQMTLSRESVSKVYPTVSISWLTV